MLTSDLLLAANSRPMLSLERLSLIKITTTLCNHNEVLSLIMECVMLQNYNTELIPISEDAWAAVQDKAQELVTDISICVELKEKIMELLWPLFYNIILWRSKYTRHLKSERLRYIYWTYRGRIDNKRTIQRMLKEKDISDVEQFILATKVCLDLEIREKWEELSLQDKNHLLDKNNCPLILLWAHTMAGTCDASDKYLTGALDCAIQSGFTDAVQYLFNILSTDAKGDIAAYCIKQFVENKARLFEKGYIGHFTEDEVDIAFFLYFYMSDEYQKLYLENPMLVGSLLLHSSDEKYFLIFFKTKILELLSLNDQKVATVSFLFMLFHAYHHQVMRDFDPRVLFIKVWKMLPELLKSEVLETSLGVSISSAFAKDNFTFVLELHKGLAVREFLSSAIDSWVYGSPFGFHPGKFDFLSFLMTEKMITKASSTKFIRLYLSNIYTEVKHPGTLF